MAHEGNGAAPNGPRGAFVAHKVAALQRETGAGMVWVGRHYDDGPPLASAKHKAILISSTDYDALYFQGLIERRGEDTYLCGLRVYDNRGNQK